MKGLRVVIKLPVGKTDSRGSELIEILEFRDVETASQIVNTLRRKPAVSAISRALLAGNRVELEGSKK